MAGGEPALLRSSFVGRQADVHAVAALVETGSIVTITGPGGVGKTRLADQVARRLAEDSGVEVATAVLNDIDDRELVVDAVATAVGVVPRDGRSAREALLTGLDRRRLVLVLDNCEHVADACAHLVADVVEAAPAVAVLATSRQPLAVPGEQIWRLAPLSSEDALQLLTDRLRAVAPSAELDEAAAAALVDHLDRLPLAIEIAAVRAAAIGVAAVLERVSDQLRLLTGGFRTAPPHHRGLEATMLWSYEQLDEVEQVVLRRLSVFCGGFTLAAAEAVVTLGAGDVVTGEDVATVVAGLVEQSLVEPATGASERHRLLQIVRVFAGDRLDRAGEREVLNRRHFEWCLARARSWGWALRTGDALPALAALDTEDANIRAALASGRDAGERLRVAELASDLWLYWWLRGRHEEGVGWLEWLVGAIADDGPPDLVAHLDFALAYLVPHLTGDWSAGIPHAQRALDGAPEGSLVSGQAHVALSQCLANVGDVRGAVELARRGLSIADDLDDSWLRCYAAWNLGMAQYLLGDRASALGHWDEVCAEGRKAGIGHALLIGLQTLAGQSELSGDLEAARDMYEEAFALRRELGARRLGYVHGGLPLALRNCGRIAARQGDVSAASLRLDEAVKEARAVGDVEEETAALRELDGVRRHPVRAHLTRQNRSWLLAYGERTVVLRDAKGLVHLRELLRRPGESVAAVDLARSSGDLVTGESDAGPVADRAAVSAYRARLLELAEDVEEARAHNDDERAARAQAELDDLTAELSRAVGFGGRERRVGSHAERARLNVTRALRRAINEIGEIFPVLGSHLAETVGTGSFCSYDPGPRAAIEWVTEPRDHPT